MAEPALPTVEPAQLCVGLFVVLDLGWMDHPFTFSSFKIKSDEQITTLQQLGLSRIQYDPARSSCPPLAASPAPEQPPAAESDDQTAAAEADNDTSADTDPSEAGDDHGLDPLQRELQAVRRRLQAAADTLRSINHHIEFNPKQAHTEAEQLVGGMVDQLLATNDIRVHALQDHLHEDTYFHSLNVAVLCLTLGKALELSADDMRALGMGAVFHDVGQTLLPSKLINRNTPMNRAEQLLFETHCQEGTRLGQLMGLHPAAMAILLQHHEMIDGSGYPHGLKKEDLSPLSRIVAIVNHYDDLCNSTVDGATLSPSEALSQMFAFKRSKLDDALLRLFIKCLGVYPPGSFVQLSDDRIGIVLAVNQQNSLKPAVLMYDAQAARDAAPMVDLSVEIGLKIARAVKPALLPREVFQYLSPGRHVTYFFDAASAEAAR